MTAPTLAICMLVKNEEGTIGASLRSMAAVADEIIVVDNGSSDRTIDVAEAHGARVILRPEHQLDEARDAYLRSATSDWILVLDADEIVAEDHRAKMRKLIDTAPPGVAGYALPRLDYLGEGRWANGRLLRLFRRSPSIRYEGGAVHATAWSSVKKLGRVDFGAPVVLHHLDLLINGSSFAKRERYRTALETALANGQGTDAFTAYLAAEYAALGDYEKAVDVMWPRVKVSPSARDLVFTAQFLLRAGRISESESLAVTARRAGLRFVEQATTVLSEAALARGDLARAQELMRGLELEQPQSPSVQVNLAAIALQRGDDLSAQSHLREAVRLNAFLRDERIYRTVTGPALYKHQDAILSIADAALSTLRKTVGSQSR